MNILERIFWTIPNINLFGGHLNIVGAIWFFCLFAFAYRRFKVGVPRITAVSLAFIISLFTHYFLDESSIVIVWIMYHFEYNLFVNKIPIYVSMIIAFCALVMFAKPFLKIDRKTVAMFIIVSVFDVFVFYTLVSNYGRAGYRSYDSPDREIVFWTFYPLAKTIWFGFFLTLWKKREMFGLDFLQKYGIGEAYMLYALKRLLGKIKKELNIRQISEILTNKSSVDFPDRDWEIGANSELLFVFRPTEDAMNTAKSSGAKYVLLAATNKNHFLRMVKRLHNLLGTSGEVYATKKELREIARNHGFEPIKDGYYDSPPWVDHSTRVIVPARKFRIDLSDVKSLLFFELFNSRFTSHHPYVLARRNAQ